MRRRAISPSISIRSFEEAGNGTLPVSISKAITPSEYRSVRASTCPRPRSPEINQLLGGHVGHRAANQLAIGVSRVEGQVEVRSIGSPMSGKRTLAGLRSRWRIPRSCAWASPAASWAITRRTALGSPISSTRVRRNGCDARSRAGCQIRQGTAIGHIGGAPMARVPRCGDRRSGRARRVRYDRSEPRGDCSPA